MSLCVLQTGQPLPLLSLKTSHQHQMVLSKINLEMILGTFVSCLRKFSFTWSLKSYTVFFFSRVDSFLKTQVFNFWLRWAFVATCRFFSLVVASGGHTPVAVRGLFSSRWLHLLRSTGCRRVGCSSWALEHRLCSCGAQAQLHVQSSQTRDGTHVTGTGRPILIHCTTRGVQSRRLLKFVGVCH